MKDRRACAVAARWGACWLGLLWALSPCQPPQLYSAGFDWERQGPAIPGRTGFGERAIVAPSTPGPPPAGMRVEAPPPAPRPPLPRMPLGQPPAGYRAIDAVIERLPPPEAEPMGNPRDKFTTMPSAQSWPSENSPGPLTDAEEQPAAQPRQAPRPSPALSAVLQKAEEHTRRGMELGTRRAYFSAREEFIQSLGMIAQALDAEQRTARHGMALAAGLRALEESDDFARGTAMLAGEVDVADIAQVHRTPVVRESKTPITATAAMQSYFTYAQEQLAASVEHYPAGSAALAGLGRLYTVLASDATTQLASAEPKAMTCHQAALLVDANNAVAANELGVMLARYGRFDDALAWLQHSAALAPQPATWHNLAVVHQNLGQTQMAESARRRQVAMSQSTGVKPHSRSPEVRWVSVSEFAGSGAVEGMQPQRSTATSSGGQSAQAPPAHGLPASMGSVPRMQPPR